MKRKLTDRERKLLYLLVPSLVLAAAFEFWPESSSTPAAALMDSAAAIEVAQARLDRARATAALLDSREEASKKLSTQVSEWEKRLIRAETPAQAQAQLNQLFRKLARAQGGTVEVRGIDIGTVQPAGAYAEIRLNVSFECQVEGLVNLLTDISAQPELLSWRNLRVGSPDSKQKRINVSFMLVGLGPAQLVKPAAPGVQG